MRNKLSHCSGLIPQHIDQVKPKYEGQSPPPPPDPPLLRALASKIAVVSDPEQLLSRLLFTVSYTVTVVGIPVSEIF